MSDNAVDHDRRRVLTAGAAALAVPLLPSLARAKDEGESAGLSPGEPTPKSPERVAEEEAKLRLGSDAPEGPWAVFAPLSAGDEVRDGWTLAEVRAPEKGAMLVVLRRGPVAARVHVCANGGCAVGPASTDALDFLIMNDGGGDQATDESLGLALLALAERAAATGVVPQGLLTHEERIERYVAAEPGALL